jgi:hypothetical protein
MLSFGTSKFNIQKLCDRSTDEKRILIETIKHYKHLLQLI